jgi:hypothetical protein
MQNFQLLEAEAAEVRVPMPWRRDTVQMNPSIRLDHEQVSSEGHVLTAMIGRNGTGKTHLLSAIVDTFVSLERIIRGEQSRFKGMPLERLTYLVGSKKCHLTRTQTGECIGYINDEEVPLVQFPLPTRIVALTITPFDKFVVPRLASFSVTPTARSRYRYLGLRDRTGRASIENLLFRSLNSLFETRSNEAVKRVRISRVFEFLKLKPKLTVVYRVRISRELARSALAGEKILNVEAMRDKYQLHRSSELVRNGEASEESLRDGIRKILALRDKGFVRLTADFGSGGSVNRPGNPGGHSVLVTLR